MFCAGTSSEWLWPWVAQRWMAVLPVDREVCLTASHAAFVITAELGHRAPHFRLCYLYHSVNNTAAFSF